MERVANQKSRQYVERLEEFQGSNMYAEWKHLSSLYVVYSYGEHFPMWVFDKDSYRWFGNKDKYSRTTSKQQSQSKPYGVDHWLDTEEMRLLVEQGNLHRYMAKKLGANLYGNS